MEKFRAFLDTQARLDRYSAANALLIYTQYPQATQLKDFNDWAEEKVSISKGAKSISILEPVEYAKNDGTVDNCHPNDLGFYAFYKNISEFMKENNL